MVLVPTPTLQDEGTAADEFLDLAFGIALGTILNRIIGHLLESFKGVTTHLTSLLINGHQSSIRAGPITLLFTVQAFDSSPPVGVP